MTTDERHQRLIDSLAERRFLDLETAMQLTSASVATVRRDFAMLAEQGVAQRFRGGIRLPATDAMLPFVFRDHRFAEEKQRLARRAVALLRPGDVVFIDGGTTTAHLAAAMPNLPLRVITNSLRLAAILDDRARSTGLEVFVTGGSLYPKSGLLVGPSAGISIMQYRANWAFLSVGGITAEGLFNTNEQVVETERRMIACAEKIVVLADHSKLARQAMCAVCPLSDIDYLYAEPSPALDSLRPALREAEVTLVDATD